MKAFVYVVPLLLASAVRFHWEEDSSYGYDGDNRRIGRSGGELPAAPKLTFATMAVLELGHSKLLQLNRFHVFVVVLLSLILYFALPRLSRHLWNDERNQHHLVLQQQEPPGSSRLATFWFGIKHVVGRTGTLKDYALLVWFIASRTVPLVCLLRAGLLSQSPITKSKDEQGNWVEVLYDRSGTIHYHKVLTAALQVLGDIGAFSHGCFLISFTMAVDIALFLYSEMATVVRMLLHVTLLTHFTMPARLYMAAFYHPLQTISWHNGILADALRTKKPTSVFVGAPMHPLIYSIPQWRHPLQHHHYYNHPLHPGLPGMYHHPLYPHQHHGLYHHVHHHGLYHNYYPVHLDPWLMEFEPETRIEHVVDLDERTEDNYSRWKSWFTVTIRAPVLEEFLFRWAFLKLCQNAWARGHHQVWFGYPAWYWVSSFLFAAAHLNNHVSSSNDVFQLSEYYTNPEAWAPINQAFLAIATHASIQFWITFFLSLYLFTPLHDRYGVWASIGAHLGWNACVMGLEIAAPLLFLYFVGKVITYLVTNYNNGHVAIPPDQIRQARLARLERQGQQPEEPNDAMIRNNNAPVKPAAREQQVPQENAMNNHNEEYSVWEMFAHGSCGLMASAILADLVLPSIE